MLENHYPVDNLDSWEAIKQSIDEYPDNDEWSVWKRMASHTVSQLENLGLAPIFRIGQGMHHVMISTTDYHRLQNEPRVTLEFHAEDESVRIAYGSTNLGFDEPDSERTVPIEEAVPGILPYLVRLWRQTKPGIDLPQPLLAEE